MGGPKLSGVIVCPKFKSAERRYTVDCASCLHLINLDRDTVATPPANSRMYGLHPQRQGRYVRSSPRCGLLQWVTGMPSIRAFTTVATLILVLCTNVCAALTLETDSVKTLQKLLGQDANEQTFLDPDTAFVLSIQPIADNQLRAVFQIANGYYLYRHKMRFESMDASSPLGQYTLPPGETQDDEYFGRVSIYPQDVAVNLPLLNQRSSKQVVIKASYQGCAKKGICYSPIEKIIPVVFNNTSGPDPRQTSTSSMTLESLIGYLAAALGAGLLLSFTPCVLPLIPIISGIIVGQRAPASRLRGGGIATVYVLGTAATYAVIGAVAGATGEQLQAYFQNAWAIGFVSSVLTLMALSMFGLFTLQLPSSLQSWVSSRSDTLSGGSIVMIFLLGALSALIVGACVSPLLVSILSVAILNGDPALGAALMFAMALGMGVILITLGFGADIMLPRAGAWMTRVNHIFGVGLLAVAIYLLQAIPAIPVLLLWAMLFIITGVYMGATQGLPTQAGGLRYLTKGVGTVLLIWGVLAMIGGFTGHRDILHPISLDGLSGKNRIVGSSPNTGEVSFIAIHRLDDLNRQMTLAKRNQQPVFLDYYADWCADCVRMKKTTFRNKDVVDTLAKFVCLQVDVTNPNDPGLRALKQAYGVFGPPAMLFFNPEGIEIKQNRTYGYRSSEMFLSLVKSI